MHDRVIEIWRNFDSQLRRAVCAKMNGQDECLDVLQDVYIKIIKNIDRIEQVENVSSYLHTLANNTVLDHFRMKLRKPQLQGEAINQLTIIDETAGKENEIENSCLQCLEPGIDTLPPLYREAFIMSEVRGMRQQEVAEKLGVSLSGVKSRVQRARQKLREEVLRCCNNGR